MVAFFSGFGVLALEVLWTRMFAQVLENPVHAFVMILVVVLNFLAAGAALSARLARQPWPPVARYRRSIRR
jgi:spermidine synthase